MPLDTNDSGNLYVPEPRVRRIVGAGLLLILAGILWISEDAPGQDRGFSPGWFRVFAIVFCCAIAMALPWWAVFGKPLEFDVRRKVLVRGTRKIAAFEEIDHIELRETRAENHVYYRVVLCLHRSRRIDLGTPDSQIDASTMAADIARVVDKPVELIVR